MESRLPCTPCASLCAKFKYGCQWQIMLYFCSTIYWFRKKKCLATLPAFLGHKPDPQFVHSTLATTLPMVFQPDIVFAANKFHDVALIETICIYYTCLNRKKEIIESRTKKKYALCFYFILFFSSCLWVIICNACWQFSCLYLFFINPLKIRH